MLRQYLTSLRRLFTLDFGHSIMSQENAAQMLVTTLESGFDVYLHTNDNDAKADWGVSPDEGCKIVLSKDEFNRWQLWRNGRDLHKSLSDEAAEPKDAKPFVDRQRQRAVEYVEKEAAQRKTP